MCAENSEREQNERIENSSADVEQSDNDEKLMEDAEKGASDAEESKDEETHSEGIEGSDNGGVSSSDKKQPHGTWEERGQEAEKVVHPAASDKPGKKIPASSFMDPELSDDEPLVLHLSCAFDL